ncbi:hypothetical protein [Desulforamulus putei]|uniref:hypothetical protein n=1 Tax=Desulforamulus putei TaxID=74701 RepID=UPI002FDEDC9B
MIKGAEIRMTFPPAVKDLSTESQESSLVDKVLGWLEHEDTPIARRFAIGICTLSGFFFAAQLISFLVS